MKMPPVVGYGYFLESPICTLFTCGALVTCYRWTVTCCLLSAHSISYKSEKKDFGQCSLNELKVPSKIEVV